MKNTYNTILLNPIDNIVVALQNIEINDIVANSHMKNTIKAISTIPYGHKIAIRAIKAGEKIMKYGECMGIATKDIQIGEHVHVQNVRGLNETERLTIINTLSSV
ncbi:UxaA family hydrolase [Lysinibacillus sp. FSL K6-0232]|uniref:UxaA family hydrolase n=1 Tax=unclassified Lysinibacillus TaxID=2636778 RepID=UPI0030F53661